MIWRLFLIQAAVLSAILLGSVIPIVGEEVVEIELVTGGLEHPVVVTHSGDGTGRLFIAELPGRVRIVEADGSLREGNFLDISDRVAQILEGGLLGLAFHPDFEQNGRFFCYYTALEDGQSKSVIAEYGVSILGPNIASPSERRILEFDQPSFVHNAGDLAFGPDGFLYISSGDGGPVGEPTSNGQDLNTLLGKILRIDVNDTSVPYDIPPDNPFVAMEDARGEVWAIGFRNPFRMSFDSLTGRLFAADVGEVRMDEIDVVQKGRNYGWSILEGTLCFPVDPCSDEGLVPPIHSYGREDGRSVTGGVVYRGSESQTLFGAYIFADFVSARIWALQERGPDLWTRRQLNQQDNFRFVDFGQDEAGELFVADLVGSRLFRIGFEWREIFAQVGDGGSPVGVFQSTIQLTNPNDEEVSGLLRFMNSQGQPGSVTIDGVQASEFPLTIAAGSSLSMTSEGTSDPLFSGWAEVRAQRRLVGSVTFTLRPQLGAPAQAGVASTIPGTRFRAPVEADSSQASRPALAVANPSPLDTVTLAVSVLDGAGFELASTSVDLPPRGHLASFLDDLLDLPSDFAGTLLLEAEREFAPTLLLTVQGVHSASLPLADE